MHISPTAREIQAKLPQLSLSEQTWLTAMAADPQIQAELAAINADL